MYYSGYHTDKNLVNITQNEYGILVAIQDLRMYIGTKLFIPTIINKISVFIVKMLVEIKASSIVYKTATYLHM